MPYVYFVMKVFIMAHKAHELVQSSQSFCYLDYLVIKDLSSYLKFQILLLKNLDFPPILFYKYKCASKKLRTWKNERKYSRMGKCFLNQLKIYVVNSNQKEINSNNFFHKLDLIFFFMWKILSLLVYDIKNLQFWFKSRVVVIPRNFTCTTFFKI